MAGPQILRSGDGWEIVNEDGLIYKRRKKEVKDPPAPAQMQEASTQKLHDDARWRRERKKAALRKLKSRYLAEIDEWEKIFERLEKPSGCKNFQNDVPELAASQDPGINVSGKQFGTLIEKLSCEVEQLEMFLQEFEALCCDCEYLCQRPDEYGEFYDKIKSPISMIKAFEVDDGSPSAELEKTP